MSHHNNCQSHLSQPTAPSLPPSVVSKRGRRYTTPLDVTEDINLSAVTPIICIQLPVEVLDKRNIGPSTHLLICLNLLFISYYSAHSVDHMFSFVF